MTPQKSRLAAAFLAFFFGGFGAHHFYLGNTKRGLLYLVFFWTLVPAMAALVETIIFVTMDDKAFAEKYG